MRKIENNIITILERHDFSLMWSLTVLCSSIILILKDLPSVIVETLPYNGLAVGEIGIVIFVLKSYGIYYRKFMFHSIVDFIGASWLMTMATVVTTAVPAMWFTGAILYVIAIMVHVRFITRCFKQKRR